MASRLGCRPEEVLVLSTGVIGLQLPVERVARGAESLQEFGALLAPMISTRVDYQEAVRLGLGVNELRPRGAAAASRPSA